MRYAAPALAPIDEERTCWRGSARLGAMPAIPFTEDVHPWMRSFAVVTDHPLVAGSGAFFIPTVPAGQGTLEAWHASNGVKNTEAILMAEKTIMISSSDDGSEPAAAENRTARDSLQIERA